MVINSYIWQCYLNLTAILHTLKKGLTLVKETSQLYKQKTTYFSATCKQQYPLSAFVKIAYPVALLLAPFNVSTSGVCRTVGITLNTGKHLMVDSQYNILYSQ